MKTNLSKDVTRYGKYGGVFMPETLIAPLSELQEYFEQAKQDKSFLAELHLLSNYAGRPTALTEVPRFRRMFNGTRLFLKR